MTVDWKNSSLVRANYIALIKFIHVLGGVYIWEFILNLDFEYSFLTGKRKPTWTFPLYLGCRWSSLFLIIVQFLGLDTAYEINCQELVLMTFIFAYLLLIFASALSALRVIAIWEHNKIIVAVTFTSWLANIVIYVYSTVTSRGYWSGSEYLLLLALMLVGLLRWKRTLQSGGIFQFMYAQGLAWVLVVAVAEVPPAVFTDLDLNDPMNLMFQALGLTIMSLGAPRIYRGLVDYRFADCSPFEAPALQRPARGATISSFGSSQRNYLGEGTHNVGGAVAYHPLSPSIPRIWLET